MLAIPSIRLRGGHTVPLDEGDAGRDATWLHDPLETAMQWAAAGFRRLHVHDVDAAAGRPSSREATRDLIQRAGISVQIAGGLRDEELIDELVADGASAVVLDSRAFDDPRRLEDQVDRQPGRILLALDVRDRNVVSRVRARAITRPALSVIDELRDLPLAGLFVATPMRESGVLGSELAFLADVVDESPWPVIAAGSITTPNDLRVLEDRGLSAAVFSLPFATEGIDFSALAEEFGDAMGIRS
ncbi:MAG: 1-(5-phosphoribosyl)-5-((5-phosphoribosylamino)methylideneamino)imidazole-4-carboxamide isomerase [Gemmatimonadaceae bacterium]|nr:1-(5-phosphoribosyl)-5-((5-phosphoribosylamino)methylideneamino)imidazole-4-carboxamide isomerase [Gemmatimonadaceae bacterium]